MRRVSVIPLWLCFALIACRPGLPSGDKPSTDGSTDDTTPVDTDVAHEDTDPLPPCDQPEVEPNNDAASANAIPLEVQGCGTFSAAPDADFWKFSTTEDGWLAVDVDGYRLGSDAHLSMTLSSTGGVNVGVNHWQDLPEIHFKMPVGPDSFTTFVRQTVGDGGGGGGGDSYFYELMASSTKAPLSWDVDETANETAATAQPLGGGLTPPWDASVFGTLSDSKDQDWYTVEVPIGRHDVVFDVDAHELGSAGDFEIQRVDAAGSVVQTVTSGVLGWEPDPLLERHVTEVETLRVRVIEQGRLTGAPAWYVLHVHVVEE